MRPRLALLVASVAFGLVAPACGSRGADAPRQAPGGAVGEASAAGDLPSDPSAAVLARVCDAPCVGPSGRVTVFRDAEGRVARLRVDGDLKACSHPPRRYFDAAGEETLTIAERPVAAGSPEAEGLAAAQAAEIAGLAQAEILACHDASRCEPARTEKMRSDFPCRSDSDCVECDCAPVNRPEFERRGARACNIPDQECIATNPACCDGRCVLAR